MLLSSSKLSVATVACFVACTLTAVFLAFWVDIFYYFLHKEMRVVNGTRAYQMFVDVPVPQYINFYFFNWTNPGNITDEKPILSQMGPYRFKYIVRVNFGRDILMKFRLLKMYCSIKEYKSDITQNENGTLSFKIKRYWYFDEKNSIGSLDDEVTTLNVIVATAGKTLTNSYAIMRSGFSLTLDSLGVKIFIRRPVREFLFDGYEDPLLSIAKKLPALAGVNIPYDKFAWFYQRNGTSDFEGFFNMDTGENNLMNLGKLLRWNTEKMTQFYEGTCGLVNGSAGELFPPRQTKDKKIEMFSPDLCRSLKLSFKEEETVHGILGNKYAGDVYTFDNGSLDASNECFCDGECSPSGVLNVTSCRLGAPGFVSFPHFYLADPFFTEQVDGMAPNATKHAMYINLEPNTGIPLDVAARFQINILLTPQSYIRILENVPSVYFPIIWFEHRASITEEIASEVRLALSVLHFGPMVLISLLSFSTLLLCYFIYKLITELENNRRTHKKTVKDKSINVVTMPLMSGSNSVPSKA